MAAYYPSLSNQRDILPVPYLRDHKQDPDPEPPYPPTNLMYMNQYTSAASFQDLFSGASPSLYDPSVGARDELEFIPPTSERTSVQIASGEQNLRCQELSLSLGMQLTSGVHVPSFGYQYADSDNTYSTIKFGDLTSPYGAMGTNDMHFSSNICEPSGVGSTTCNSKYLKAAQQLLSEVVNVQEAMKQFETNKHKDSYDMKMYGSSSDPQESTTKCSPEISPSERQDMQNKLSKLMSMLDEVSLVILFSMFITIGTTGLDVLIT